MSETVQKQEQTKTVENSVVSSVKQVEDTIVAEATSGSANSDVAEANKANAEVKPQENPNVEEPKRQEETKQEEKKEESPVDEAKYGNLPKELHRFQDSYQKNGKLTEADYAELQKMGIPKAVADEHVQMRQKLFQMETEAATKRQEADDNAVVSIIGGKQEFDSLKGWAVKSLSDSEKAAFNNIMNGKDLEAKKLAMSGLHARYRSENPKEPNLINGNRPSVGVQPYEHKGDWLADIANPRYKVDAGFRASVDRRLAVSRI